MSEFEPLTAGQYTAIATELHECMRRHDPVADDEIRAWNALNEATIRLCTLFDRDPEFQHGKFLGIVMNRRTR